MHVIGRVRARLARVQDRSLLADHGVRAVDRFLAVQGALLAAAVSYYGFLALFPLVAVAFGVTSVLSQVAPSVQDSLRRQLAAALPTVDIDGLARAGITVGILGLVVLAYAGVKWISSLRRSVSLLWEVEPRTFGYLRGMVRDILALTVLGGCLLASAALSLGAEVASDNVGGWIGLAADTHVAVVSVLVLAASLIANFLVGWVLFRTLPNNATSERSHLESAAIFSVGFQLLVQLLGWVLERAAHSLVYGTFAATVGVLIWVAYVSRLILAVAAWAATASQVRHDGVSATGSGGTL